MIKKRIFAMIMAVIILMGIACKKEKSETDPAVNVVLLFTAMAPPCDNSGDLYHAITLDYGTSGRTHYQMGEYFGLQTIGLNDDFERIFDWYIYMASAIVPYGTMIQRALAIKPQIPAAYQEEINGLASVCTGTEDKLLDGKLSLNEVYLLQTLPDVWISASCSSVAVFGTTSATGKTIIGRNLEWFGGIPFNYLSKLQAVVTVKNTSGNDVCLIGYLGFLGCITGFNDQGLFGAIQVSNGDTSLYDAAGKGSYNMNLRYVLETQDSVADAG
ncbi:MAG TPA: C45 family autoproteolytic acyltransferase/hydrolase, partial [Spirochaetota bacterium]|nr:C45 family autoproteolytic acyltransferase/hydrolase [Spirochaetota bacterium]HRS76406.1 C45 family autoproteolytic acyltransferase/hydrolase [Spirochaetota bacterium]